MVGWRTREAKLQDRYILIMLQKHYCSSCIGKTSLSNSAGIHKTENLIQSTEQTKLVETKQFIRSSRCIENFPRLFTRGNSLYRVLIPKLWPWLPNVQRFLQYQVLWKIIQIPNKAQKAGERS
ncbi:unnamed protein product, partial [Nesidiocoris tenuis]